MIILKPDGTTAYSLGGTLPAGCVEIGLDGCQVAQAAAITPLPPPAPVAAEPVTPAAPKVDFELQAALQRLRARTGLPK